MNHHTRIKINSIVLIRLWKTLNKSDKLRVWHWRDLKNKIGISLPAYNRYMHLLVKMGLVEIVLVIYRYKTKKGKIRYNVQRDIKGYKLAR